MWQDIGLRQDFKRFVQLRSPFGIGSDPESSVGKKPALIIPGLE